MNPALTWRCMFNVNGQFETLLGSWLIGVVQDALGCFGMLWNALECFGMLDWDDCCWWFWLDDCRGRKQRRKWRERANGNAATTCCATTSSPRSLSSSSPSPSNCFCWGPTPPRPSPSTGSSLLGFIYSFFEKNISWWNQGWDVIVPRGRGEGYQLQSSIALLPEHRYRFQNSIGFRGELFGFPLWESWKNLERILKESLKNLRRISEVSAKNPGNICWFDDGIIWRWEIIGRDSGVGRPERHLSAAAGTNGSVLEFRMDSGGWWIHV